MRLISKLAKILSLSKVMSDKPSYVQKKKTDSGGFVWLYGPRAIKKRWDEKRSKIERLQKGLTKLRKKYNDDLKKKDIPAGPAYSIILRRLRAARLNGIIHTRQEEKDYLDKILAEMKKDDA